MEMELTVLHLADSTLEILPGEKLFIVIVNNVV